MSYGQNLTAEQRAILFAPDPTSVKIVQWMRDYCKANNCSMNVAQREYQLQARAAIAKARGD